MSRELFKSLVYKKDGVYTRQSSNNVNPKFYDSRLHHAFTDLYNKLGQEGFEKWLLKNCILEGNISILPGCSKNLKRLNYIADFIWDNEKYQDLRNQQAQIFEWLISTKNNTEKNELQELSKKCDEDMKELVSTIYDRCNSRFLKKERER